MSADSARWVVGFLAGNEPRPQGMCGPPPAAGGRHGTLGSVNVQDKDWAMISRILDEIERLLREAGDAGADWLDRLRQGAEHGDRPAALETLTGANTWNHMGSFFDRSLDDRTLDRAFRRAQIQLAEAFESAGVATSDVRAWASTLRTWESQGI